ncbi:hypothetical protein J7M22_01150 [Candidatus Poribacteria bacterium]|nr:hypothetical protein [Candidatus Poribacteria bacterium]
MRGIGENFRVLYEEPYDPKRPVICFDEKLVQLIEDVMAPIEMKSGNVKKEDYQR